MEQCQQATLRLHLLKDDNNNGDEGRSIQLAGGIGQLIVLSGEDCCGGDLLSLQLLHFLGE